MSEPQRPRGFAKRPELVDMVLAAEIHVRGLAAIVAEKATGGSDFDTWAPLGWLLDDAAKKVEEAWTYIDGRGLK